MKLLSVFFIVMVLIFSSCIKVDLIPLPKEGLGGIAYCKLDGEYLVVQIKNNGTETAPASTTKVEFLPGGAFEMPTPQIPANGTVEVRFQIPVGCSNPDCDFKITVDSKTAVQESNEGNNSVDGNCIG